MLSLRKATPLTQAVLPPLGKRREMSNTEIDNLRVKMGTHIAMRVYFEKWYEKEKVRADNLEAMVDRMSSIIADCAMLVTPLRELCYEIEKCGASEQLTKTVILASEIQNELKYIVGGVAVEHRVHPTSEILRDLQAASTIEQNLPPKPDTSPLTRG
jgi:co-chaperonin GroES (HSP10)